MMEPSIRKAEVSKEAQSAFNTFTARIDAEIQQLNDDLAYLEKTTTEIQRLMYEKFDPYVNPPWWIRDPAKFKDLEQSLDSSVALIIDLLIEVEMSKSLKPTHEEAPIAQTVAPHVQVNVPATTPATEERTAKSYGLWSFLHDVVYRPKPQSNGGPSRVVEDKEVYSLIENLRQIPPLLNELDEWYGRTLLERTLIAPNPEGYISDNDELATFLSKIFRILSSAIPAARRLKERLVRFQARLAETFIQASTAEHRYVPIGAEEMRRA